MLDTRIRALIDPALMSIGKTLSSVGITANQITLCGFVFGIGCALAIINQDFGDALIYLCLSRLADGLDGCVARHQTPTAFGGYLDIVCDFIFYSLVPFSFAVAMPEHALAACFLIFSFIGTGSSFLAYAILQARYPDRTARSTAQHKSFFYLGGLTEATETIGLFVLFLIFPASFGVGAWIFGLLCWLTTGFRVYAAWSDFGKEC